ncbi:MAG: YfhO family protein [Clostridia bacterium]|nr:YfhO family protein [Clostridia bacterium]
MNHDLTMRRRITAAHAFLLGALLALFALAPAILPYGGQFVTRGDYIEQQLPFILEARRILRGGLNSYSFSTFLGAPAVGSYAFYTLGSPFVWPLALLPQAAIPYGISVMAVLKHAVCALTAFLYLRRMVKDARLALLGSVLYAFSSFTVVNTQFYHFTEVVAFFPLILLGLEIAMGEHPRPGLLALFCGLNTLVNYYFMLSSALLAAMYFAFRFFSAEWRGARSLRRVVITVFECGVGCALAGVMLVPAMWFMLSITRTGGGASLTQAYPAAVLLERLRALLMPIESNVVHAFYGDAYSWTSTACHLPALGLTGAAVFASRRGHQGWLRALLMALLVCSAVPALCGAFALFTNLAYTRWWYGLALMLVLASLYALASAPLPFLGGDAPGARRAWLWAFAACALMTALLTLPFLLPQGALDALSGLGGVPARIAQVIANRRTGAYAGDIFRVLSLALSALGAGAMLLLILGRLRYAQALALVCLCACVQYGAYIAVGDREILAGGTEPGQGVYPLEEIAAPTLGALALPEPASYTRIDYGMRLRNYGLLRGQSSLTCFNSLRASVVGRFVSMAGFGYDESTTVSPPDGGGAIRALLSVTQYHQTNGEPVPEGFVYSHEENGFPVYTSDAAVPMGFLQTTVTGTHHQRMDSGTVGEVMLAAATLEDEYLERIDLPRLDVYAIPAWEESAARLRANACDSFATRADGFDAHIDAKEAGLLVFTIPYDKGFTAYVDGQRAEIIPCDAAFMSVWVGPGGHDISFTYRTRGLTLGIAMSAAAAIVFAAYVLLMRRRRA